MGTNKEEEKGIWFSHLVLFPALLLWLRVDLSHPHVAIFFSPVFVFDFVFFFIVYIQVLTARLSEQILVFVLLENNNNNKTTKKKIVATRILGEKKS